jgi:hypothetical protein
MTKRHTTRRYLAVGLFIVIASASSSHAQPNWPMIQPVHETRTFANLGNVDNSFVALIKDTAGVPVYKFECHNGNYEGDSEINFSGDLQCALFAIKESKIVSPNLLAANTRDEQSTDWWNRGRMRSEQLRGECLAYPDYSTDRHFKLRGMLVTLRFSDIEWSTLQDQQHNPMLVKFTFNLDAIPDKTASAPSPELAGAIPPRSCYP